MPGILKRVPGVSSLAEPDELGSVAGEADEVWLTGYATLRTWASAHGHAAVPAGHDSARGDDGTLCGLGTRVGEPGVGVSVQASVHAPLKSRGPEGRPSGRRSSAPWRSPPPARFAHDALDFG